MKKFFLDENVPPAIGIFLRGKGYDVVDVWTLGKSGASDRELISLASREERVLVSFDKHFADIIAYPPGTHHGIIRIRIHPPLIEDILAAFEKFLFEIEPDSIRGSLIILEKRGFRLRRSS